MESPILFDLDGTLWDSVRYHDEAWRQIFERRGIIPPSREWLLGRPTHEVVSYLSDFVPGISYPDIRAEKSELFCSLIRMKSPRLYFQMADLRALGSCLGIVTGASLATVNKYLDLLGGDPFQIIHTEADSKAGKPHPQPYLDACARLGLDPSSATVIEDSENGVASAKAAGCRAVHFSPGCSAKLSLCWCAAYGACCVRDVDHLMSARGLDSLG